MDDLLSQGIAAAKSGQRERARELLMRLLEQDERNAPAWLWLSSVVDGLEEREICLENVLAVDPDNSAARRGLVWVREQKGAQPLAPAAAVPESPVVARTRTPISPAAAILRQDLDDLQSESEMAGAADGGDASSIVAMLHDDLASRQLPPQSEQPSPPPVPSDEFGDEYLCPYCASPTAPDDRKCKTCGGGLWVKSRRQEKRSKWLWFAMALQLPGLLTSTASFAMLLMYVSLQVGGADPFDLLLVYFGLPNNLPPDVTAAALELLPRQFVFLATLPSLVSLTVFSGLYLRWRLIYYLYWISAVLGFVSSVVVMFLQEEFGVISGGVGAFFALLMLLLAFRLEDDFKVDRKRVLLCFDRGLGSAADFLAQGNLYARQKMWAMAVIHLRRAVSLIPGRLDSRLALTVAYANLKRYDLALRELAEADRTSPGNPRVAELRGLVDRLGEPGNSL